MTQPPPPRGPIPSLVVSALEGKLEREAEVLDVLLNALARGALDPSAWQGIHDAARRDGRIAELAFAYESVANDRRLKNLPSAAIAEFMLHAGSFFIDVCGDVQGAISHLERALEALPTHPEAFSKLEALLHQQGETLKLVDLYRDAAAHRPRGEQVPLLRQASELLQALPGQDEKAGDTYQQILRLEPSDEIARLHLAALYRKLGRHRDVARILEQGLLVTDPTPSPENAAQMLAELVELYANQFGEIERATPHVEALLALEPTNLLARRVAEQLLGSRGVAARSAAALASAYENENRPDEVVRFLEIELEHTRGTRRRDVLRKLGIIKQDNLGDAPGAYDVFESCLTLEPGDDDVRTRYIGLATDLGRQLDAARVLGKVATAARDAMVRVGISLDMAELFLAGGDRKRARAVLGSILGMAVAPEEVILRATRALAEICEAEGETTTLAETLERMIQVERDPERLERANVRLAELASGPLDDPLRAAAAWRAVLNTDSRARALSALEEIYAQTRDTGQLAFVLSERAADATEPLEARTLLVRAAEALSVDPATRDKALETLKDVLERFGPEPEALRRYINLLEDGGTPGDLADALVMAAELASGAERAQLFGRAGDLRLNHLGDPAAAITAFEQALAADPSEATSRAALESLAERGPHRAQAAHALEVAYRADGATDPLLRMLDVRARSGSDPSEKIDALTEAATIAMTTGRESEAMDFVQRGLTASAEADLRVSDWVSLAHQVAGHDPGVLGRMLHGSLADREITSEPLFQLALAAAQALEQSGELDAATAAYERAVRFAPAYEPLVTKLDEIYRASESPRKRMSLHRGAVREESDANRRAALLATLIELADEVVHDTDVAIEAYEQLLATTGHDEHAFSRLAELYEATGSLDRLVTLLDERIDEAHPSEHAGLRIRVAEVAYRCGQNRLAAERIAQALEIDGVTADLANQGQTIARQLDDVELVARCIATRAGALRGLERADAYEELGLWFSDRLADVGRATDALEQAAAVAERADDRERAIRLWSKIRELAPPGGRAIREMLRLTESLERYEDAPALLDSLAQLAETPTERVEWLTRLAETYGERLDQPNRGFDVAKEAFGIQPSTELLDALVRLGDATSRMEELARTISSALADSDLDDATRIALLAAAAKAKAVSESTYAEALDAFRELLDGQHGALDATLQEHLIAAVTATLGQRNDEPSVAMRRWLWRWRVNAASSADEKIGTLVAWSADEMRLHEDPERALTVAESARDVQGGSKEANATAVDGLVQALLANGRVDDAAETIRSHIDRSDPNASAKANLEIARHFVEHGTRPSEAMEMLEEEVARDPSNATALALIARLLQVAEVAPRALSIIESSYERVDDPDARAVMLAALLDAPCDESGTDGRRSWYTRLISTLRAEDKDDAALSAAIRAAEEFPTVAEFWDSAEELTRITNDPEPLRRAYGDCMDRDLPRDEALELGRRAVLFHEEWFDDTSMIVPLLERTLTIDRSDDWAFERLKLLYDSREQWPDLFALYDRTLQSVPPPRARELLEDAAQIAKDFANEPDRAIQYFEQIRSIDPDSAATAASLERLYERSGHYDKLVRLIEERIEGLVEPERTAQLIRLARVWLENLGNPTECLTAIDLLLGQDARGETSLSAAGSAENANRAEIVGLLESIVDLPPSADSRESLQPSAPPEDWSTRESYAPRARKRMSPRLRAASLLREHYAEIGDQSALARMLEVELESVRNLKERVRRHRELAELYVAVSEEQSAIEHYVALVGLEPETAEHREALATLARRTGQEARLAEVLVGAAEECSEDLLRVTLLMEAAQIHQHTLEEPSRAVELYLRVAGFPNANDDILLSACQRAAPILEQSGRLSDLLETLERQSDLEMTPDARWDTLGRAARLAAQLGVDARACHAWEARLNIRDDDLEALDGLIAALTRLERWEALADAYTRRSRVQPEQAAAREDRVRVARLHDEQLDDRDSATREWVEIEAAFGPDEESTSALATLYERSARWPELAQLLRRAADSREVSERPDTLTRLGAVHRDRLDDPPGAVAAFAAALAIAPHHADALDGIRSLLRHESTGRESVSVLLEAYRRTNDWAGIIDITELRIGTSQSDAERVSVFLDAAKLAESSAHDPEQAFGFVRRAFALTPADASLLEELERLGALADDAIGIADSLAHAVEALESQGDHAETGRVRMRLGHVFEHSLSDPRGAMASYVRAATDLPEALEAVVAVIRMAGPTMRWDAAARALVEYVSRVGTNEEDVFAAAEMVATTYAAWDSLTSAIATAVDERSDLDDAIACALHARLGAWHRDRRGDPDAAEAAFEHALRHDAMNADLLSQLTQLQRRAKGRPLVDSLLRLSQATGGDLELLQEAAEIASGSIADRALAKSILDRMLRLATERWHAVDDLAEATGRGAEACATYARWAIDELAAVYNQEGDADRIVDLFVESAELPFDDSTRRDMLLQAAEVAADRLGDVGRAIQLFRRLLAADADDEHSRSRLVSLYTVSGRTEELLQLRRDQAERQSGQLSRFGTLREVARLEYELGRLEDSLSTLRGVLESVPRDEATVLQLADTLSREGRATALVELFDDQAERAKSESDTAAAIGFLKRAAEVAKTQVGDDERAIALYDRVLESAADPVALDALATLTRASDPARSAGYLRQLREALDPTEWAPTTVRLVDALEAAGAHDDARTVLEEAVAHVPESRELRDRLGSMYRQDDSHAELAKLLADGVAHLASKEAKVATLLEAATIHRERCQDPASAVPLLRQLAEIDSERQHRLLLADALGASGEHEDAATILRELVEEFGGRRPKERAVVHYHLARLAQLTGDRQLALSELESARRIDPADPDILLALAQLARDNGEAAKAERSFRALLAVVRKHESSADAKITRSEVLLELSELARREGEDERAEEVLESAFETAASDAIEADHLERALRNRGLTKELARALELRANRASDAAQATDALLQLAQIALANDDTEAALRHAERAVGLDPMNDDAHEAFEEAARRTKRPELYADALQTLANDATEQEDAQRALALWIRSAKWARTALGDSHAAAEALEHAEELSPDAFEILVELSAVYDALGRHDDRLSVLERIVEFERDRDPRDHEALARATLELAELTLAQSGDRDVARALLESVAQVAPRSERLLEVVERAALEGPPHKGLAILYGEIARGQDDEDRWLAALRRRASAFEVDTSDLRAGCEVALERGRRDIAIDLLVSFTQAAENDDSRASEASWALASLGSLHEESGEYDSAARYFERAARLAVADDARALRHRAATIWRDQLGNDRSALALYRELVEEEPTDRSAWEPLFALLRADGQREELERWLATVADATVDDEARAELRLERARLLLDGDSTSVEGRDELREILQLSPNHAAAEELYLRVLDDSRDRDDLIPFLERQIDAAKDAENAQRVGLLAARLVSLLRDVDDEAARAVAWSATEWPTGNASLARALVELVEPLGDDARLADALERWIPTLDSHLAPEPLVRLVALRTAAGDDVGVERAYGLGVAAAPQELRFFDALSMRYREGSRDRELAELYDLRAEAGKDPTLRVDDTLHAAELWCGGAGDLARAILSLERAFEIAPENPEVIERYAATLVAVGRGEEARDMVAGALDRGGYDDLGRARLARARAKILAPTGDDEGALADLELAYQLDPEGSVEALDEHLVIMRDTASALSSTDKVVFAATRRATLFEIRGMLDEAVDEAARLSAHVPDHPEAQRLFARLAERAEQFERAASAYARLANLVDDAELENFVFDALRAAERADVLHVVRPIVERAYALQKGNQTLREKLRGVYVRVGANAELAEMSFDEAEEASNDRTRIMHLLRGASILIESQLDLERATEALDRVYAIQPNDLQCAALRADVELIRGSVDAASAIIQDVLSAMKGRRSRDIAALHHRMARIAHAAGDSQAELEWLSNALEMDTQNGHVASELAECALTQGELDVATRALRVVTMLKTPAPLPRALAYQRLGEIARHQGDLRKAQLLLKRAIDDDPELETARSLLAELEARP